MPAPSLADLKRRIAAEEVRAFLVPVISDDPRIVWITSHCKPLEAQGGQRTATSTEFYECAHG